MTKQEKEQATIDEQEKQKHEAMYNAGMHLIGMSDRFCGTSNLKRAIADIELMIHTRNNLPF